MSNVPPDPRIGHARAVCAAHVTKTFPKKERAERLAELLEVLGLLPTQEPDRMLRTTMSGVGPKRGPSRPSVTRNVGTSFGSNYA